MSQKIFRIEGMTCHHCQMAVTEALKGVQGVSEAQVDLDKGEATVEFTGSAPDTALLAEAVSEAGYVLKPAS